MTGQDEAIRWVDKYTYVSLPQSFTIVGDEGSGRHTLCQYISDKFGVPTQDITETINLEKITEIQTCPHPFLYIIDTANITEKNQNALLKILEEPPSVAKFVLLVTDLKRLLPTIQNRCEHLFLKPYTEDDLIGFITNDLNKPYLLKIAKTPGQILKYDTYNLPKIYSYVSGALDDLKAYDYADLLRVNNNLAYGENDGTQIDSDVFFKIWTFEVERRSRERGSEFDFEVYKQTHQFLSNLQILHVDKKLAFENCLFNIKLVTEKLGA